MTTSLFSSGAIPVGLRHTYCTGIETRLIDCRYSLSYCYSSVNVGVRCHTRMSKYIATKLNMSKMRENHRV